MKNKKLLNISTIILSSLVAVYLFLQLIVLVFYTPQRYPFIYYSTGIEDLAIIDHSNKDQLMMSTSTGKYYTEEECDQLMPVFNYRQLMSDGIAPDTILGVAVDMRTLMAGRVVLRQSPRDLKNPVIKLHTLFEAMPLRVGLTEPDDVFRLNDNIEFIDAATNSVNSEKSDKFQTLLEKRGFAFPAQWNIGNPSSRKAYDEGYFSLDAEGKLFHIKMVNDRPYIKDTKVSEMMEVAHFAIYECANRRFYGFVFSKDGGVYILEAGEGKYTPKKLDLPPFDIYSDDMLVMGDLFYWTIGITNDEGKRYFALESGSLEQVDSYSVPSTKGIGYYANNTLKKLRNFINF